MALLVMDPTVEKRLKAEREESGADRWDEVWEGVYVMSPLPNNEHQELALRLSVIFDAVIRLTGLGRVFNGANVSDREQGWTANYRQPDVAVFLQGTRARDCGTHWCGGPDFAVEILSPHDHAREKRPFYATIGVQELMLIDRDPWAIELYRLDDGQLDRVGRSSLEQPDILVSSVLPLAFRLLPGDDRPRIEAVHSDGVSRWLV